MRQLIFANISLINLKGMYNYIEECVYTSVCVCVRVCACVCVCVPHLFMAFEIEPQNILEAKNRI